MKRMTVSLFSVILVIGLLCGCSAAKPASPQSSAVPSNEVSPAAIIADIPTTQYFTDEAVDENDLKTILTAGINAPSAINKQPWHFSVVTDGKVLQQIADDMKNGMKFAPPPAAAGSDAPPAPPPSAASKAGIADAPLAVIISCKAGSELDAGLACQNMSAAANLLGYGTKIISSPTIALNGEKQAEYREMLGIPEDQAAAAVLLIGHEDKTANEQTVDGYAGASTRNPMEQTVTFIAP